MSVKLVGQKYQADIQMSGIRHRKGFDLEVDARAWEAEMRRRGKLNISLSDIIDGKKAHKSLEDVLNAVYEAEWCFQPQASLMKGEIKRLLDFFGNREARSIKTTDVDAWITHLQRCGLALATVNRKTGALKKALRYALDRDWISTVPKIRKFADTNERLIFWSPEQEKEITDAINILNNESSSKTGCIQWYFFKQFLIWSIDTGMRPSESRRMKSSQVRFDPNKNLYMCDVKASQSKTGKKGARSIPLTKRAYEAFKYALTQHNGFPWQHWTTARTRSPWDKLRVVLNNNDPDFVFYIARHTCASRMVQRGVPITVVKDWMGHSNIETTMIYAKLAPDGLMVGLDALQQ